MTTDLSVCPVCLKPAISHTFIGRTDVLDYTCSACGRFVIRRTDAVDLKSPRLRHWRPAHLSALLRERTIRPLPKCWLQRRFYPYVHTLGDNIAPICPDELLAQWPRTVPERIGRTLCNLAVLSQTGGQAIEIGEDDIPLAFAETYDEARFHIQCLIDRGYIRNAGSSHDGLAVALTADGWERFEELTHGASAPENPVFVAMWFGDDNESDVLLTTKGMMDVYRRAIECAVTKAGYHVIRVDLHEHNEWIMDKVLGDIKLAPLYGCGLHGEPQRRLFRGRFCSRPWNTRDSHVPRGPSEESTFRYSTAQSRSVEDTRGTPGAALQPDHGYHRPGAISPQQRRATDFAC